MMDVNQIAVFVQEQVELAMEDEDAPGIRRVESFEEAGVLTQDEGFVVVLDDGSRFIVRVGRSR